MTKKLFINLWIPLCFVITVAGAVATTFGIVEALRYVIATVIVWVLNFLFWGFSNVEGSK